MAAYSKSERRLLLQLAIALLIAALARSAQGQPLASEGEPLRRPAADIESTPGAISRPDRPRAPMPRPTGSCNRPANR